MKVKEIMERAGTTVTGRAVAYIKDALEEIAILSPADVKVDDINIVKDQRFYTLPSDLVNLLDVRVKDHDNEDGKYRSIPRAIYEPAIVDEDGS